MENLKIILLLIILLICGISDLLKKKIYNWVTFPAIILGFIFNYYYGEWNGLWYSLAGFGVSTIIFFLLYALGGFGAGDVKLMMAIGSIANIQHVFNFILFSVLAGGIMANIIIIKNKQFIQSWKHALRFFLFLIPLMKLKSEPLKRENSVLIPYGYAISIGSLVYLLIS